MKLWHNKASFPKIHRYDQNFKIVYVLLLVILVILPFFITKPILFFQESHAEALTILIILGLVYLVHHYDIKMKEKEQGNLEKGIEISIEKRMNLSDI